MIVCSCRVLTDKDFVSTLDSEPLGCPRSAAEAYRCLGCGPECGRCLITIRRILADARALARCRDCGDNRCDFHRAAVEIAGSASVTLADAALHPAK